ncbi:MAG: hypothetical protein DHS20C14_11900 [Phycisphaeraceae bacterium]|nr:MAG: hypothetical protein DHS20C14_11900 [Phycisphaeraceae bacterium]
MRQMRRYRPLPGTRHAFSLLELTLVLVIIGLLMGVATVALVRRGEDARIQTTQASMNVYKGHIQSYMVQKSGSPPASLAELVTAGYVEATNAGLPTPDAWEMQFYYSPEKTDSGRPFSLISAGPDKEFGTVDDIDLWTIGLEQQP